MLAQVLKLRTVVVPVLLCAFVVALTSCAITEANSPGQRSRRSWWIRHPMEQAGTMGKRRAIPGHDRPPLDPIVGSGDELSYRSFSRCFVRLHSSQISFRFRALSNRDSVNRTFGNVYEDEERARAYATLEFPGTYYLAFRDLPAIDSTLQPRLSRAGLWLRHWPIDSIP